MIFILHKVQTLSVNNRNENLFPILTLQTHLLRLELIIQSRTHFFADSPVLSTDSITMISQEYQFKPITIFHCEILTRFSRLLALI